MNLVIVYDVNTQTAEGQRRLRRVAKACEAYGQRVQYSVFEVVCSRANMVRLLSDLETIMEPGLDAIRVYPLEKDGFDRVIRLGVRRELPHGQGWVL